MDLATTVVRARRKNGESIVPFDIYIGRRMSMGGWKLAESIWANPFAIGRDGSRDEVLRKYREYVVSRGSLMAQLPDIYGRVLACWCKPADCHGDILAELAERDHWLRSPREYKKVVPRYRLTDREFDQIVHG